MSSYESHAQCTASLIGGYTNSLVRTSGNESARDYPLVIFRYCYILRNRAPAISKHIRVSSLNLADFTPKFYVDRAQVQKI
jgi:hypothetical protein